MIPIQEAVTIVFTSIIWSGIMAHFMLNEAYSLIDFGSGALGMIGTTLIVKPPFLFSDSLTESSIY